VVWGFQERVVDPTEFKRCVGKHSEQFAGYDQQDSQELIACVLDAIHEDTNRGTWS
jgi:ubiquitin C-terminal hydrolase